MILEQHIDIKSVEGGMLQWNGLLLFFRKVKQDTAVILDSRALVCFDDVGGFLFLSV